MICRLERFRPAGRATLPTAAKFPKRRRGLSRMRLGTSCLHLIHSAPRTPRRTARLRKMCLVSGAPVTGLCQRRFGCRPAQFNRFILLSNKAPTAQQLSVPRSSPAQLVGRTTRQVCRHSGSKRVRSVSLPGAGSVAVRFLGCGKRKFLETMGF